MLYGAMFDEVDEGTAMFKLAATARSVPAVCQSSRSTPTAINCRATGTCSSRAKHSTACPPFATESGHASVGARDGERAQRSEPRERSEPAKRLARERVGESEGRSPSE